MSKYQMAIMVIFLTKIRICSVCRFEKAIKTHGQANKFLHNLRKRWHYQTKASSTPHHVPVVYCCWEASFPPLLPSSSVAGLCNCWFSMACLSESCFAAKLWPAAVWMKNLDNPNNTYTIVTFTVPSCGGQYTLPGDGTVAFCFLNCESGSPNFQF